MTFERLSAEHCTSLITAQFVIVLDDNDHLLCTHLIERRFHVSPLENCNGKVTPLQLTWHMLQIIRSEIYAICIVDVIILM